MAIELQRVRCRDQGQSSKTNRIDLNFYVVAVARLYEVARQAHRRLGLSALAEPLRQFDQRWPRFREARNRHEHHNDPQDGFPSEWWYFPGSLVGLKPRGDVEYLIDTEMMEPFIERLYAAASATLQEVANELETRAS